MGGAPRRGAGVTVMVMVMVMGCMLRHVSCEKIARTVPSPYMERRQLLLLRCRGRVALDGEAMVLAVGHMAHGVLLAA